MRDEGICERILYILDNNAGHLVARLAVALGTRERGGVSYLGSVFALNSQFERLRAKENFASKAEDAGKILLH